MDPRRHSPAAARNAAPILAELQTVFPAEGQVLEIAAGSGQHAVAFARAFPGLQWLPTDPSPVALASIAALRQDAGLANLQAPQVLDTRDPWPARKIDAVLCVNLTHISPWAATEALVQGAARVLSAGGPLVIYGPFRVDGAHTSAGNVAFDRSLRQQDPRWGIRDAEAVDALAAQAGLVAEARVSMPANNRLLVYRQGR